MNNRHPKQASHRSGARLPLAGLISIFFIVGLFTLPTIAEETAEMEDADTTEAPGQEATHTDAETALPSDENTLDTESDKEEQQTPVVPLDPATSQRSHWGLKTGFEFKSFYDSNIFIEHDHPKNDWINQFAPSIKLGLGDYLDKAETYLAAEYTARESVFLKNENQNSLDHDFLLSGMQKLSRLSADFALHFKTATEPNSDAGRRTRSKIYEANLTARYDLTARTALESDFLARQKSYDGLLSANEAKTTGWFVYQATAHIDQSLGVAFGKLWPSLSNQQTYEQLLSRTRYLQTALVTSALSASVEHRGYEGSSKSLVSPIVELDVDYNTHAGFGLYLVAFRRIESSSLYENENRVVTGLGGTAKQTLTRNWSASLSWVLAAADYNSTVSYAGEDRNDIFYSITPSITYQASERWSAAIFTQYRQNDSTQDHFSYQDFQAGISVDITF